MRRLSKKKERLRNETGGRAIVVVDIVDILRVELDLVVVELEVRRLGEVTIGIWFLPLSV
jgi:hypothetical protein